MNNMPKWKTKFHVKLDREKMTTDMSAKLYTYFGRGHRVVFDSFYALFVEFGTRPHPVSKAGIENLKNWAMLKFGQDEKEAWNTAYAVAAHIRKFGTKEHPFMRPAVDSIRKQIPILLCGGMTTYDIAEMTAHLAQMYIYLNDSNVTGKLASTYHIEEVR